MSTSTPSPFVVVVARNEIIYESETQREADAFVDAYRSCFNTEELNGTLPVARQRKRGDK